mgnify:CR=1 FL=1
MKKILDQFQDFLILKGLRMTGQRELIAKIFFQHRGHISIEELHHEVQKTDPGIGYATVYRTLKLLSDAGLAAGRSFGNGFTRYEPDNQIEHHDHLICTRCGAIIEFENNRIESLQKSVAGQYRFEVTHHVMELYGICSKCRS